jgi:putative ABC transport system permease protein
VRPPSSRYGPSTGPEILDRLLTRIQRVPGVESAALNRCVPFTGCSRTTLHLPGEPAGSPGEPVGRHYVSPDYFRTLGIPVLAGRALSADDRIGRPPVAVVSETGARRYWPGENPLGKRVWFGSAAGFTDPARPVEIVGVVGTVKYGTVDQSLPADFYTSYLQFSYPDSIFAVKGREPVTALVPALRAAVASVDASLPIYDVQTLDTRISGALDRPRFNAGVVALFAGAAVALASLGLFGTLTYAVSSQMREIGVRLALGASRRGILGLVLGDGLRLVGLGAAIGVGAAMLTSRLLRGLLPDIDAGDLRLLLAGVPVMLLVGAVAAVFPARRASAVDPIVVLRND